MAHFSYQQAAERAGVSIELVTHLVTLGVIAPHDERLTKGDVRKIGLLAALAEGGLPIEAVADQIRAGTLSIDFLDNPVFDHFSLLSEQRFADVSAETRVPVELLMVIREAIGSPTPRSTDLMRDIELQVVPLVQVKLELGYPPEVIERGLRTMGDALRRHVLAEADAFARYVIGSVAQPGVSGAEIDAASTAATERLGAPTAEALLAMYRAQQAQASTSNIVSGFERDLAAAGLHARPDRPPAMCFLDITGFTRLTAEQGDKAAAQLAEQLTRLVQRTSVTYGGRPVKWLGDGVMFWFRDPGPGVLAALDMADGVAAAGLPPAHLGLHAGSVIFQDGDYYGQTVNLASRIAEYARPGEVLVTQAVVDAAANLPLTFTPIGPVELKGVGSATVLYVARRRSVQADA